MRIKALLLTIFTLVVPLNLYANEGEQQLYHINPNISDTESLQRGARIFVNYCMGCHSAAYMRYNRIGKDLGITDDVLKKNFIFGSQKVGDTMEIAMKSKEANKFFGVSPPDLSVIARSRGADWLYSYFLNFYLDPSRPTGVNNLTFKDVAMPDVLWELQGFQRPVYKTVVHEDGTKSKVVEELEEQTPGKMKPEEYKKTVYDLVNFLVYLSEPAKMQRLKVGFWVIIYLLLFLVLAYFLKKEYWKDVH